MTRFAVAVAKTRPEYPKRSPFSPSFRYPEYRFSDLSDEGWVYDAVRTALHDLSLDDAHWGTAEWNPFCDIVHPGDRVVIKPNLVLDFNGSGDSTDCLVTHASVLRPIVDYVALALGGKGTITIADSSHGNANFPKILEVTGLVALPEFFRSQGIELRLLDLRKYEYGHGPAGFIGHRQTIASDPAGYLEIDLGAKSALADLPHLDLLYGADFDRREIRNHHHATVNRYLVARTFLTANVIINVPKLKTHKKIGATLNLKSLIGINGDKNYLPHYRIGDPKHGGDEFPDVTSGYEWWLRKTRRFLFDRLLGDNRHKRTFLYRLFNLPLGILESRYFHNRKEIVQGDWHGNETVYRTCYDLVHILFCADDKGVMHTEPQRRFFSVIDGIVGGEKEGPLSPSAKPSGVILAGSDPVATDFVATRLMGLDPQKMVVFTRLSSLPADHPLHPIRPEELDIRTPIDEWKHPFASNDPLLGFEPHSGWKGYLEI